MQVRAIRPFTIDPADATDGQGAFRALADAARHYLASLDHDVRDGRRVALVSRVRGTGPGVSFGRLIEAMRRDLPLQWQTPFEGSEQVSGAPLRAREVLGQDRDDGFLFLRFAPGTQDLPLHIHPGSDRFIIVIGGRGFFHVSPDALADVDARAVRHIPARDRDVFLFTRGTVHTFSTDREELLLLSYHRPFIELDDPTQYAAGPRALCPEQFLTGASARVSFDVGWSSLFQAH